MNVLITGIEGLIGGTLAKFHLERGDSVFGIDKYHKERSVINSNIVDINLSEGIEKFLKNVYLNCTMNKFFKNIILNDKIDIVYHCAAKVGVSKFTDCPVESYRENYEINKTMQDLMCTLPSAKFVFMSSSEVYGSSSDDVPFTETDPCKTLSSPRGLYASEKYCAEQCFSLLNNVVYNFRLFNIVGTNQNVRNGFIPKLILNLRGHQETTIYSGGVRCYCHVSDAVRMMFDIVSKNAPRGVYNIGNPALRYSNELLASSISEILKKLSGKNYPLKVKNIDTLDEIGIRVPNIDKALKYTNKPEKDLEYIVKDFLPARMYNI